jgi:microcystin-dependent protein
MFSLNHQEFLPPRVAQELDSLIAQLQGFLSVSLNEDGTLQGLDLTSGRVPIGAIEDFAGPTAPSGWLVCDGTALSRVTYKPLFEVIGTTWGAGDGSTTFNLPDFRGRFRLTKAASGTGSTLAATGGSLDHTHSVPSDGSHQHTVDSHAHTVASDGDHTHTGNTDATTAFGLAGWVSGFDVGVSSGHVHPFTTGSNGAHDHDGVTGAAVPDTGLGGSHDHSGATGAQNPPFAVVMTIIFAGA